MSNGLFIGRFQPFHDGHKNLIEQALSHEINTLLIGIGSANRGMSLKNPFSYKERVNLLSELTLLKTEPYVPILYTPVDDYYDENSWHRNVLKIIQAYNITKIFYHDKKDGSSDWVSHFKRYYSHAIKGQNIEFVELESNNTISSTVIRNDHNLLQKYVSDDMYNKYVNYQSMIEDYRNQFIHPYSDISTFFAVDLIWVVDDRVLLIKRKGQFGGDKYALIGGFVDGNEDAYDAIIRETKEEIGVTLSKKYFIGDVSKIYDNPNRSDRGRIITKCFVHRTEYSEDFYRQMEKFEENDEVSEIVLIDRKQFHSDYKYNMFADHALIISDMLGW